MRVDWSRTDFFWIDERAVPPDDPDSNYALALKLWLEPARVPGPDASTACAVKNHDLDAAAAAAAEELVAVAGNPPHLDVALVGVGEDGHVASIFAGRETPQRLVAPVRDASKPPPRRLTLTLQVLATADRIIVVALGRSKAAAVRDAVEQDDPVTPVAELLHRSKAALLLLDREAAALLKGAPASS